MLITVYVPAAICVSIPVSSYIYVTVTGPAPVHGIGFVHKAALVYVNVLVKVLLTFSVPGFAERFTVFVPDPVPGNFPLHVTELYYCLCFLTCTFSYAIIVAVPAPKAVPLSIHVPVTDLALVTVPRY